MNGDLLKNIPADILWWVKGLKKEAIGALALIVLSLLFRRFVYLKNANELTALDMRIKNTRHELEEVKAVIISAETLKTAVTEASEEKRRLEVRVKGLNERITSDKQVSRILAEVTGDSPGGGLRIISIKPMAPEEKGELMRLPFQLTLEGRFIPLGGYLERIENLPRLIIVDNFMMEPKDEGTATLTAKVYLSAYVLNYRR